MKTPKVLVVEDNPLNLELVREILEGEGYQVVEARDGTTGVKLALAERPDLILMDVQLPGVDGYEATRRIRADESLAGVRIVALTAHAMKGESERARAAGCDGFIAKPIEIARFSEEIRDYLGEE